MPGFQVGRRYIFGTADGCYVGELENQNAEFFELKGSMFDPRPFLTVIGTGRPIHSECLGWLALRAATVQQVTTYSFPETPRLKLATQPERAVEDFDEDFDDEEEEVDEDEGVATLAVRVELDVDEMVHNVSELQQRLKDVLEQYLNSNEFEFEFGAMHLGCAVSVVVDA